MVGLKKGIPLTNRAHMVKKYVLPISHNLAVLSILCQIENLDVYICILSSVSYKMHRSKVKFCKLSGMDSNNKHVLYSGV